MYGYNVPCYSYNDVVNSDKPAIIFLNGGCYNKELKYDNKSNVIFISL